MLELKVTGMAQLQRELQRITKETPQVGFKALTEEAELEMTEAKRRTPVDTGALRASGTVRPDYHRLAVDMTFGNAAVDYAIPVHELEEVFHKVGQAKFLESVLLESIPFLAGRVARRMRELLRW